MPRILFIKFNKFQVFLICQCIHNDITNLTEEHNLSIKVLFSHAMNFYKLNQ